MGAKNKIGPIVEGQDFVGRVREQEDAWELLENGHSLILAAPRRVGKSSFSKKLIERAKENGWSIVDINLEGIKNEANFINTFVSQLKKEKWYDKLGNFLKEIKLSVKVKDIEIKLERKRIIYEKLKNKLEHDRNTLIIFDELTIFLNNLRKGKDKNDVDDVEFFLHWLRDLRLVRGTKIRWIFCSSIGVESFTSKHNLSDTMNDMAKFKIDELEGDEPILLIKALAESKKIEFSDEIIQCMLSKLNWNIPYFIQVLFKSIVDLYKIDGEKLSIKTVEKAYNGLVSSTYFNTWEERLSYYPEEEGYTRLILNELSKSKNGISRSGLQVLIYNKTNDEEKSETILTQLLFRLKNDGYIMFDEKSKKYLFRSPLLRDFWYNRFIK